MLTAFFEARRGQLHGFRFRDPVDHASGDPVSAGDQPLGTGDGATDIFPLVKRYGDDAGTYDRLIRKPVVGSVQVAIDDVARAEGTDFTVDYTAGEIAFSVPPAHGAVLTAGFEFDVPVRFDTDHLAISMDAIEAGDIADLPIVEIRV